MRQIFIDTETTGFSPRRGDRLVEIACVEVYGGRLTGREFHSYVDPERDVPPEAEAVHGLSTEFLRGKPRFADIAGELMQFAAEGEILLHNAPFDIRFLAAEFQRIALPFPRLTDTDSVTDTLTEFRRRYPGQSCALAALCEHHGLRPETGEWHSALTDARMLARLWLASRNG